jgi:hypothetical protein
MPSHYFGTLAGRRTGAYRTGAQAYQIGEGPTAHHTEGHQIGERPVWSEGTQVSETAERTASMAMKAPTKTTEQSPYPEEGVASEKPAVPVEPEVGTTCRRLPATSLGHLIRRSLHSPVCVVSKPLESPNVTVRESEGFNHKAVIPVGRQEHG